ncbi:MAG: NADH-quinone oxidoreductase subunit NuoH [Proteobacteria bacterium]|nr:NADH-quinone oxidoreductase subunit NuoH [Pseudomonadota bacterium]
MISLEALSDYFVTCFWIIVQILTLIVPLILGVAYLTFFERKVIGYMQLRVGPNMVGPFGLLQPIADGIKLIHKEFILPSATNKVLFILAPVLTFALSLTAWAVIPFSENFVIANINVGVLYLLTISSLGVYGIIIAGWASNSKYAFLGALRSAAQMISYEVSIGVVLISVLLMSGTLNLTEIVMNQKNGWNVLYLFPMWVVFFISCLAETNRAPFDLPEAESELVAGYNVEYSSLPFALFFLGEYANMILMSGMNAVLFFGGWLAPFNIEALEFIPPFMWMILKICFFLFLFLWIRASLPRYRYDQLMRLGWKVFLPLTFLFMTLQAFILLLIHDFA